jgi:hypothetical protein
MRFNGKRNRKHEGALLSPGCGFARCVLMVGTVALLMSMLMTGICVSASQGGEKVDAFPVEGSVSDRIGVASPGMFWDPPAEMDKEFSYMKAAGIKWLRCTFPWTALKTTQGADWDWTRMDMLVDKAEENGINIVAILINAPPWANELDEGNNEWGYPPDVNNEDKLDLWLTYVSEVCTRYGDRIDHWEVYNEPNNSWAWPPEPNLQNYMKLLEATSLKIREVQPNDFVILGGMAGAQKEIMEQYLAAGAANYVDAINYHPYPCTWGSYAPDEAGCRNKLTDMHNLITQYSPEEDLEVWLTELGFFTQTYNPLQFPVNEPTQASFVMRTMLLYSALDADMVFYNSMKDENPGFMLQYDTTGLLHVDISNPLGPPVGGIQGYPWAITDPKPSYYYFQTMEEVFGNAVSESPTAVSYSCNNPATLEAFNFILPDGDLAIAAWKTNGVADSLSFTVADPSYESPVSVSPSSRSEQEIPSTRDAQGRVTVSDLAIGEVNTDNPDLSTNPVIIKLNKGEGGVVVTSITPSSAETGTNPLNITSLAGDGFQAGATVRLEMSGQTPITATNVVVVSANQITCTFNLTNAAAGAWDVVVVNLDNTQGRLIGGFTVTACGQGATAAVLALGVMMGLMSLAGAGTLRRRFKKRSR